MGQSAANVVEHVLGRLMLRKRVGLVHLRVVPKILCENLQTGMRCRRKVFEVVQALNAGGQHCLDNTECQSGVIAFVLV